MKKLLVLTLFIAVLCGAPALAAKVDINAADADALVENLKGIGPAKARAIVEYRKKNGPFASVDDLKNVSGIGEATINKNRADLSLKGGATTATKAIKDKAASAAGSKTKTMKDKTDSAKASAEKVKTSANTVVDTAKAATK